MEKLKCEWGSSQPVRFGGLNVTLHDAEGNEVELPSCKCGKPSDTWIQGKDFVQYFCNECLFPDNISAKFIYKPPVKIDHDEISKLIMDTYGSGK